MENVTLSDFIVKNDIDSLCHFIQNHPAYNFDGDLAVAAVLGKAECVRYLLAVADPKYQDSEPLCLAARGGHLECVKLLLPVSETKLNNYRALQLAVWGYSFGESLFTSLPIGSVSERKQNFLNEAHDHAECINLLLTQDVPLDLLHHLRDKYVSRSELSAYLEHKICERQHLLINEEVKDLGQTVTRKM